MKYRIPEMLFDMSPHTDEKEEHMNAVRFRFDEPFKYTSGLRGPCYVNNRTFQGNLKYEQEVVDKFVELIEMRHISNIRFGFSPVRIAAVASSGIPWGTLVRKELKLPGFYVSKKPKEHGLFGEINGTLDEGNRVILIEDLITTGGSSVNAINAIRNKGGIITEVYAIFDYGLSESRKNFDKIRCNLVSLTNLECLLEVALKRERLDKEEVKFIKEWQRDPIGFAEKMWDKK